MGAVTEANDYRAADRRAGYVDVSSIVGALGPNVVKTSMTRRLEPRDRVRERGGRISAVPCMRSSSLRTPSR